MSTPQVSKVQVGKRQHGVAGQYGYWARITYTDGDAMEVFFSADSYDGPHWAGSYRLDSEVVARCGGVLTPAFIRKFYGLKR